MGGKEAGGASWVAADVFDLGLGEPRGFQGGLRCSVQGVGSVAFHMETHSSIRKEGAVGRL